MPRDETDSRGLCFFCRIFFVAEFFAEFFYSNFLFHVEIINSKKLRLTHNVYIFGLSKLYLIVRDFGDMELCIDRVW